MRSPPRARRPPAPAAASPTAPGLRDESTSWVRSRRRRHEPLALGRAGDLAVDLGLIGVGRPRGRAARRELSATSGAIVAPGSTWCSVRASIGPWRIATHWPTSRTGAPSNATARRLCGIVRRLPGISERVSETAWAAETTRTRTTRTAVRLRWTGWPRCGIARRPRGIAALQATSAHSALTSAPRRHTNKAPSSGMNRMNRPRPRGSASLRMSSGRAPRASACRSRTRLPAS